MTGLLRLLVVVSVLVLAAFSAYATSAGLNLYGASWPFAIAGGITIETVLLAGLYVMVGPGIRVAVRIFGGVLYAMFAVISVYGSFVTLNAMMALSDRRSEADRDYCQSMTSYAVQASAYAKERWGILQGELAKLQIVLEAEGEIGLVSGRGKGKRQMYNTVRAVFSGLKSLQEQFLVEKRWKEAGCKEIAACANTRACCEDAINCIDRLVASLPRDEEVEIRLGEERKLLSRGSYGDIHAVPSAETSLPVRPSVRPAAARSKKELVDAAWAELISGTRPETTRSFYFAVLIDVGLLVLSALQALLNRGGRRSPSGAPTDGDEF